MATQQQLEVAQHVRWLRLAKNPRTAFLQYVGNSERSYHECYIGLVFILLALFLVSIGIVWGEGVNNTSKFSGGTSIPVVVAVITFTYVPLQSLAVAWCFLKDGVAFKSARLVGIIPSRPGGERSIDTEEGEIEIQTSLAGFSMEEPPKTLSLESRAYISLAIICEVLVITWAGIVLKEQLVAGAYVLFTAFTVHTGAMGLYQRESRCSNLCRSFFVQLPVGIILFAGTFLTLYL